MPSIVSVKNQLNSLIQTLHVSCSKNGKVYCDSNCNENL